VAGDAENYYHVVNYPLPKKWYKIWNKVMHKIRTAALKFSYNRMQVSHNNAYKIKPFYLLLG